MDSVSFKNACFLETFNQHASKLVEIQKYISINIGMSREQKIYEICAKILLLDNPKEDYKYFLKKFEKIFYKNYHQLLLFPNINQLLKSLNKLNYINLILSSAPKKDIEYILGKYNIKKYFREIYETNKNKTNSLKNIMKLKKIGSDEVFYIGDSIEDYRASSRNKVKYFHVNSPFMNKIGKKATILNEPFEILSYIENSVQ